MQREATTVESQRFGASRRLFLSDTTTNRHIELTGSSAFSCTYAAGAKAVLKELGQ
jgi:hypothetical protein